MDWAKVEAVGIERRRHSGGRLERKLGDGMWSLERESSPDDARVWGLIMGGYLCFSMMWGSLEDQLRVR